MISYLLKMVDFSMAMLNSQRVFLLSQKVADLHPRVTCQENPTMVGGVSPGEWQMFVVKFSSLIQGFFSGSILANMSNMFGLFQDMDSQGLNHKNNDDKLIGWNGVDGIWWNGVPEWGSGMGFQDVPSKTTPVWEKGKGMDWSSQGPWVLRFRCVIWRHTLFETIYWTK